MKKLTYLLFLAIGVTACSVESMDSTENLLTADMKVKMQAEKAEFGIPMLSYGEVSENSLQIIVTAGQNGATGGISVRWMTSETYNSQGWVNELAGHANLKENPNTVLDLDVEGDTFEFNLGDYIDENDIQDFNRNLECGLSYYFIVQASQDGPTGKSEYSDPQLFSTSPCETVCAHGKGYWKNHSSNNPGEQEDMWPVSELMLGNNNYTQDELNVIMDVPNNEGNNLVIFSQHLIAAKLNVANGAGTTAIAAIIEQADDLIGALVVLEDTFSDEEKTAANLLKGKLETYNESGCN